jgi:hypothetical protein
MSIIMTADEVTDAGPAGLTARPSPSGSIISARSAATRRVRCSPAAVQQCCLLRLQAAQERVLQRCGLAPEAASSYRMFHWPGCAAFQRQEVARFIAEAGRFEPLSSRSAASCCFQARIRSAADPIWSSRHTHWPRDLDCASAITVTQVLAQS